MRRVRSTATAHARAALLVMLLALACGSPALAQTMLAQPGTMLEPFALGDDRDGLFRYRHGREITILVFVTAHQKRSERALADVAEVLRELELPALPQDDPLSSTDSAGAPGAPPPDGAQARVLVIVPEREAGPVFRTVLEMLPLPATILLDSDDQLRGRLGVRVTPTTFLLERDGRIAWARAGHAFDYGVEARTALRVLLDPHLSGRAEVEGGPPAAPDPPDSMTPAARAHRHMRVAQALAWRGRVDDAIAEAEAARLLLPESATIDLALAELLCRAGRAQDALAITTQVDPITVEEKARTRLASGWAYRLLGDHDRALLLLREAVELDERSERAWFELGRTHEAKGETTAALAAYRRALELRFGAQAG